MSTSCPAVKHIHRRIDKAGLKVSCMCILLACLVSQTRAQIVFQPTIESLKQYITPEWFMDAKLGIFMHWGPQSIGGIGGWYARQMYEQGSASYNYHVAAYGHPSVFGYKDICRLFTAANFDSAQADYLVKLYRQAGAKYIVPVAVHHDNFDMWNSTYQPRWNSVAMAGKDIIGMWRTAALNNGLRLGVSSHVARSYRWFQTSHGSDATGSRAGVPYDGQNTAYQDLYGIPWTTSDTYYEQMSDVGPTAWELQFENRMIDLFNKYHPDLLYIDGGLPFHVRPAGLNIAAYLYNQNQVWNGGRLDAVLNIKLDWVSNIAVFDNEFSSAPGIIKDYWQSCKSVNNEWYWQRNDATYKTANQCIDNLADIASRNGNMLLNFPLQPDGTLNTTCTSILTEMAQCVTIIGEAIFSTRCWEVHGEGPTDMSGGTMPAGTATDIRFTRNKANAVLYAIVLDWPGNGATLTIKALNSKKFDISTVTSISMLGSAGNRAYTQDTAGLKVTMPSSRPGLDAFAVKISFSGQVPSILCPAKNPFVQLEAENFDDRYGAVQAEACGEGGQNLGYIQTGDWVSYCNTDFKNGALNFSARIATETSTSSGRIDIRLDSATGTLVGTLTGSGPGGWQTYATRTCTVSAAAAGSHTLYLVFQAGYNVNWFRFTQSPVAVIASGPGGKGNDGIGAGTLCFREFLTEAALKVPANARGVEIVSLQGKKLFRCRFDKTRHALTWKFGALQAPALPEVFVVRYLTK